MVSSPEPFEPPAHTLLREIGAADGGTRTRATDSSRGTRRASLPYHAAALALLATMGFLLSASMRDESPTTDETVHLTRGVAFYWGHAASLSYAHPPLGNALAALPIVLREPAQDLTRSEAYQLGQVERVGRELLEDHYDDRRRWFFQGRSAVALMTLGLAAYCYAFALQVFGPIAALAGLFFIALNPTLIAHGRSMTTDMPVTIAMTISLGELVLYLTGRARWHAATAALMFGAAIITKYTALGLVPLFGLLGGACAWFGWGRYSGIARRAALRKVSLLALLFACTGLFMINAIYDFDRSGLSVAQMLEQPEPENAITKGFKGTLLERRSMLKFSPGWLRVPLPYTYFYGITSITVHDRSGHKSTFFGKPIQRGHFAYFPVLLAIKTPLLELCAAAFALCYALRRRLRVNLAAGALAFYATALLLVSMGASINIGIRHILPLLPVLAVLAGLGAAKLWQLAGRSALRTSVAGLLLGSQAFGLAWCYPDYISDFNALVGGRKGGEEISIVGEEWGQDTARLGAALQARGVDKLRYNVDNFTTTLELARFGVAVERLGCGKAVPEARWLAVNAREFARSPECWKWLEGRVPAFVVNNHVAAYENPAAR